MDTDGDMTMDRMWKPIVINIDEHNNIKYKQIIFKKCQNDHKII